MIKNTYPTLEEAKNIKIKCPMHNKRTCVAIIQKANKAVWHKCPVCSWARKINYENK